jgi:hypothetical protein
MADTGRCWQVGGGEWLKENRRGLSSLCGVRRRECCLARLQESLPGRRFGAAACRWCLSAGERCLGRAAERERRLSLESRWCLESLRWPRCRDLCRSALWRGGDLDWRGDLERGGDLDRGGVVMRTVLVFGSLSTTTLGGVRSAPWGGWIAALPAWALSAANRLRFLAFRDVPCM